jgi:hypothetical protein
MGNTLDSMQAGEPVSVPGAPFQVYLAIWICRSLYQVSWTQISTRHELVTPLTQPLIFSTACGCDLAEGGFFVRQGEHICTRDYQRLYGTRCFSCDRFIEGEVVSALGKTYHPDCFVCAVCR